MDTDAYDEEWRHTPLGPPHVLVSSLGRVRTEDRVATSLRSGLTNVQLRRGKVLAPWIGANGYAHVAVKEGSARRKYLVHRLVAAAFCNGFAPGLSVNHIDGNKTNNHPANLEWTTLAQNTAHAWSSGLVDLRGEAQPSHKLTERQVRAIRKLLANGAVARQVAMAVGVSDALVYLIRDGRRWSSVK